MYMTAEQAIKAAQDNVTLIYHGGWDVAAPRDPAAPFGHLERHHYGHWCAAQAVARRCRITVAVHAALPDLATESALHLAGQIEQYDLWGDWRRSARAAIRTLRGEKDNG